MLQTWLEDLRGFNTALMCVTLAIHTTHHVAYNPFKLLFTYTISFLIIAHFTIHLIIMHFTIHYLFLYTLNGTTWLHCTALCMNELNIQSDFVLNIPILLNLGSTLVWSGWEKVHWWMESRMCLQFCCAYHSTLAAFGNKLYIIFGNAEIFKKKFLKFF